MGVAEVARLLARTLASPATRQVIMDRALVRVARTCSVSGGVYHGPNGEITATLKLNAL
jgi:hypothetical protein